MFSGYKQINRYLYLMCGLWTSCFIAVWLVSFGHWKGEFLSYVSLEAQTVLNKDLSIRTWATMHGGVYVPPTEKTPPNPYLDFLTDRDVVTTEGKKLTLMNPAYMIRQVMSEYESAYGIKGHITSLNPINPVNASDEWEATVLKGFEANLDTVEALVQRDGEMIYRKMIPLITKKGCLKCHARQGYTEGDIRGGISVTMPVTQQYSMVRDNHIKESIILLAIYLPGLVGLFYIFVNISKREEIDEKFRKSIKNSPLPTLIAKLSGEIEYLNTRFTEILGYTIKDIRYPGQWWSSAYPDEDYRKDVISRWQKATKEATSKGDDIVVDTYDVTCKDGTVLTMEICGTLIGDSHMIMMQDITKRKKIEKDLLENRERLRLIINKLPTGCITWDMDFKAQLWNPKAEEIFGYTAEEAVGKHPYETIVPESFIPHVDEMWKRLTEGDETAHSINENITKDGRTIVCEWYNTPLIRDGEIIGVIAMVNDVTQKYEIDKKLKQYEKIVSASKDRMCFVDSDYRYQAVNDSYLEAFNKSRQDVIGKTVADVMGEDLFENVVKFHLDDCLKGNTVNYQRWFDFPGVPRIFQNVSYYPYKDSADTVSGVVVNVSDITDIKLAEEKISASLMEKEVLLKEVHHRVKNNMAVISSLLSLQSGYIDDERYLNMFNESQSRIRSMALVHEKLYQSDDFAHIDVSDYLKTLVQSVKSTFAGDTDISLEVEVEDIQLGIDTLIPCGLIVNELLTNSFKYAFNKHEAPALSILMKEGDDAHIELTIADNGKGLPEGLDVTAAKGLGLKLVNILVNQIDGKLEVKSENGAVFMITFPSQINNERHSPKNGQDADSRG